MMRIRVKDILKKGIPEADYAALRLRTFEKIKQHDDRKRRLALYFVPRSGMGLLLILLAVNFYSFFEEALYAIKDVAPAAGAGLSAYLFVRPALRLADNAILIVVNVALILILNPRFLGIQRVYRKAFLFGRMATHSLLKIPVAAWGLMKRS